MKWDLQTLGSHPLTSTVNENVQILFSFPGGKLAQYMKRLEKDFINGFYLATRWASRILRMPTPISILTMKYLFSFWPTTDSASWGTITFRVIWTAKKLATWSKIILELVWQPLKQKWLGRIEAQLQCHHPTTDQLSMWYHPSVFPVTLIFCIIIKKLPCRILKQNS